MGEIRVEVRPGAGPYGEDLSGNPPHPEAFAPRADEIADSVAEVANRFRDRLDSAIANGGAGWRLGEVELSFGLDLEAESGVLIAKERAGCTFSATLTWSREGAVET
jgi:NTP-dependent ternary system trypsin peptidase co-occuring protein